MDSTVEEFLQGNLTDLIVNRLSMSLDIEDFEEIWKLTSIDTLIVCQMSMDDLAACELKFRKLGRIAWCAIDEYQIDLIINRIIRCAGLQRQVITSKLEYYTGNGFTLRNYRGGYFTLFKDQELNYSYSKCIRDFCVSKNGLCRDVILIDKDDGYFTVLSVAPNTSPFTKVCIRLELQPLIMDSTGICELIESPVIVEELYEPKHVNYKITGSIFNRRKA